MRTGSSLPSSNDAKKPSVRAFLSSHVGRIRRHNEDLCAVSAAGGTPTEWTGELAYDGGWALLPDGMGGHVAGEVAAAVALEVMREMMPALRTNDDICRAVNAADAAVFLAMEMKPELHGMGTTIAGVMLRRGAAVTFNVGDSRVYAFEQGRLRQVSTDDVTKGGALLQCLGGIQEPVPVLVHIGHVGAGAALLLCSDGLTDMLSDVTIGSVLRSRPANPAAALVDAAVEAGGQDNVTAIVIDHESSAPHSAEYVETDEAPLRKVTEFRDNRISGAKCRACDL